MITFNRLFFFHLALGTLVLFKCLTTSLCFGNLSANPNKAWEDHRSFHILGCLNLLNSLLIGCFYFSAYIPKIWCSWTRKCDCGWAQGLSTLCAFLPDLRKFFRLERGFSQNSLGGDFTALTHTDWHLTIHRAGPSADKNGWSARGLSLHSV